MEQQNVLKESLGSFLRNLWDLMLLNWLWVLCSLPIVTAGPATCGLYAVTLKLARKEPVYTVKDFFRGFRENLKPGLLLGAAVILLAVVAGGDAYFALSQEGTLRSLYLVIAIIIASAALTLLAYAFALQAMFDNPLKLQLLNVMKLAVVAPGRTVLLWLILLTPVGILLLLPPAASQLLGPLYVMLGISGPVYACSRILRNLFDRVEQAVSKREG